MIKRMLIFSLLLFSLILSACAGGTPAAPQAAAPAAQAATQPPAVVEAAASATLDPCLPQYARILAQRVHNHMREFDDASTLAVSLTVDKLPPAIAELQRIRRASQDEPVPACLGKLRDLEVGHMNMVINTLLAMLNGAQASDLQTGIGNARKLHDAYTVEFATVMGLTVVVAPTSTPGPAVTVAPVMVSNPGPSAVNLRDKPDLNGSIVGSYDVNANTVVLGKSADSAWVQIEVPGKPGTNAWLYLQPVKLSGPLDGIPVVAP